MLQQRDQLSEPRPGTAVFAQAQSGIGRKLGICSGKGRQRCRDFQNGVWILDSLIANLKTLTPRSHRSVEQAISLRVVRQLSTILRASRSFYANTQPWNERPAGIRDWV